ncbi:MAG: hypothetical protein LC792_06800 [Actinobacteria bacterium]|nr:hypothetical protein [Actinomycetota bacterium]
MDVEDVAAGRRARPDGAAEGVAADDRAEPDHEGVGQAGLDRRQGNPARTEAEDAVTVDLRHGAEVGPAPAEQPVDAGPDVGLGGRQTDPVLQAVEGVRRRDAVVDQQQSGDLLLGEARALFRLVGPLHQHHVHDTKR